MGPPSSVPIAPFRFLSMQENALGASLMAGVAIVSCGSSPCSAPERLAERAQTFEWEYPWIIDTHVWLSGPNSWGDLTMMDDAMIAAGWTEIGEKTGLNQGMSGEEMVACMDEAGVDKAISHAIKMPHLDAHVPSEFVAGEVAKFPDRLIGMRRVDLLGGLPALREMEEIVDMSLIGKLCGSRWHASHPCFSDPASRPVRSRPGSGFAGAKARPLPDPNAGSG